MLLSPTKITKSPVSLRMSMPAAIASQSPTSKASRKLGQSVSRKSALNSNHTLPKMRDSDGRQNIKRKSLNSDISHSLDEVHY